MKKKATMPAAKKPAAGSAPPPDEVLIALLGWWDGITNEIGRVVYALSKYREKDHSGKFPPGYAFAEQASFGLLGVQDALDNARPDAPRFTTGELVALIAGKPAG